MWKKEAIRALKMHYKLKLTQISDLKMKFKPSLSLISYIHQSTGWLTMYIDSALKENQPTAK